MKRSFSVDPTIITRAVALLAAGRLVAMPTETVYGLAGCAENEHAVAAIFAAKGRPAFNPLIVHVDSLALAQRYGVMGGIAATLVEKFWPGPLTVVVPRVMDAPLSLLVSAGLETVALRMPAHPVARELIAAAGFGLAAPSANRSGRVSPTHAAHVAQEFTEADEPAMILDGGACAVGLESTVVDCTGAHPVVLRHGGVTLAMLRAVIPETELFVADSREQMAYKSPGMLVAHYAPALPVRLQVAADVRADEALLAFGGAVPEGAATVLNLSEQGDVVEAAAHLFAYLRALDDPAYAGIAVMPIPEDGIGAAINDRLRRAAAGR